ncbi:GDSL-type esterase/lipase family protein [Paenibacillus sp. GCM10027627]|uniref:GDSL-type esterase/lipase family protein n=1 Tax=unclassified Paenibacillus TaxID=185978 RepID=UPI00363C1A71
MKQRSIWPLLAAASLLASLTLIAGFGLVVKEMWLPSSTASGETVKSPPSTTKATPLEEANEIRIVALGDSLTKGTGDSSGKGYVTRLAEGLNKRADKPAKVLNNLAVGGMRASELSERLAKDNGYRMAVEEANLIVFTIGGNDLFMSARAKMGKRELKAVSVEELTVDMDVALDRFRGVVRLLHELNPAATIVYMGLYNPFYDIEGLRDISLKIQVWNKEAYETLHAYPNMLMVPTFDLFEGKIGDYLSSDHFHPGDVGYERIASRMLESLK